jgi:hypothetical protein
MRRLEMLLMEDRRRGRGGELGKVGGRMRER